MCWTMLWDSKASRFSKGKENLCLPDVSHLVLSAAVYCADVGCDFNLWDFDISEVQLSVGKLLTWALTTAPNLADCFTQFFNARLESSAVSEELEDSTLSLQDIPPREACNACLLTCGRAWAISLTLRGTTSAEILKPYLPTGSNGTYENLLYQFVFFLSVLFPDPPISHLFMGGA